MKWGIDAKKMALKNRDAYGWKGDKKSPTAE
jgi:hypothetical protein